MELETLVQSAFDRSDEGIEELELDPLPPPPPHTPAPAPLPQGAPALAASRTKFSTHKQRQQRERRKRAREAEKQGHLGRKVKPTQSSRWMARSHHLLAHFELGTARRIAKGAFVGLPLGSSPQKTWTLQELKDKGFTVIPWDGR